MFNVLKTNNCNIIIIFFDFKQDLLYILRDDT